MRPLVLLLGAPLPPPYGGIARYLTRAVRWLTNAGYRICVVQPPGSPLEAKAAGYPSVRVGTAPSLVERESGFTFLWRRPMLAMRLARWYARPLTAARGHTRDHFRDVVSYLAEAERLLEGERPEIVHAFDSPWLQGTAAALLAGRYRARLMLTTFGELMPHASEMCAVDDVSRPFRGVSHRVLERADLVSSMTEHCRRQVGQVGLDPSRVRIVRMVVGMDDFHPNGGDRSVRQRYGEGDLLLYVGQLRPRKGPQVLIEAMPEILRTRPDTRLLLVGPDHGYAKDLRRRTLDCGVKESVDFVGPVSDEELPDYYRAADAFLFPTLTPIECLGLSFVQAMFCAKPVVATRIAGAPEVIEDRVNGYLVEPGDQGSLAKRVGELLEMEPERRAALGRKARRRVQELFDEGEVMGDLLGAYGELAQGGQTQLRRRP